MVGNTGVSNNVSAGPSSVVALPGLVDGKGVFNGFGVPIKISDGKIPQSIEVADVNRDGAPDIVASVVDGTQAIFGRPPVIRVNNTLRTARNLGTVVHVIEPTLTIVPGHLDAYYTLTVPTESARGAGEEVIDFSGLFQAETSGGLHMEVLDAAGDVLGSGERFRISAAQGQVLTLHVFGSAASDGSRGAGAYTLDIDVLPRVVSIEAQALLPGRNGAPGGPTASLVLTLQGDRLNPATAEKPANYTVIWLGPDGLAGTVDDQVIPPATSDRSVVYSPSSNVDVAGGVTLPTAVRQTVTLLFSRALPASSYRVALAPAVQAESFTAAETARLSGDATLDGHPVVSLVGGQIASGALGDFGSLKAGNLFLSNLHDDLGALLDGTLTRNGDDPNITRALIDQVLSRFEPALGRAGQRLTSALVLWLDPVSIGLTDPTGGAINYNTGAGLSNTLGDSYVNVVGNIEVIVIVGGTTSGGYNLTVGNVPQTARVGAILLGANGTKVIPLTAPLGASTQNFVIPGH